MEINEVFNTLEEGQCQQLCKEGKCRAECCGCVSFPEQYFRRLKFSIPKDKEYTIQRYREGKERMVKPLTPDMRCVFLAEDNSCVIHKSSLRPNYCKRFGQDPKEPLYACDHINEDCKEIIDQYRRTALQMMKGNAVSNAVKELFVDETQQDT